ncbi:LuxR C-terminal-related transcriptional regulator [Streptomyces thermodiastaticus]|uniref:LuxR C-terminal-related transcriptional regulator n=1 Tax=Streptomyces thermodiastaticus TaxID=44061 RepID=UPI0016728E75|nr:response regulator transcription factor [Streptomyces thermodiastaticus]MCE7553162.1 response regulator transcription factor [Streptomyces thermodiastaticus]GHE24331.1 DNA-binding response regulator [Streptomyces thermodiastaticus]
MAQIVIISDCPLLRRGLKQVIDEAPDLRSTFVEPAGEYDVRRADVAVVNLHTGMRDVLGLIARLDRRGCVVLVLSPSASHDDLLLSIEAGARGYVSQSATESELLTALRTLVSGRSYFSTSFNHHCLTKSRANITARERQIIDLVASGATDREIAVQLNISQHTVHSHLDRLASKTGYRRRVDLARLALRQDETTGMRPAG